jgi:DNA-binding NarL/FixJ family response regulator
MRCLIIDDDESPRQLMTSLVLRAGHQATAVNCGRAAIETARSQAFDIAIVDMEMPGRNGPATIGGLRALHPGLRVLVVSGYDDRRHVLAALEAGADGYLVKDEVSESLTESLQSVRAGYTPLSPRVAAIMLRQLRKTLDRPPVEATALARVGLRSKRE